VSEVRDGDVEGVGDPRATLLGRAGRTTPGQLDDEAVAADLADPFHQQAELAGEEDEGRGVAGAARDDEPGGALAEQLDRRRAGDRDPDARAEAAPDGRLGEGRGKAAPRDVLSGRDEGAADRLPDETPTRPPSRGRPPADHPRGPPASRVGTPCEARRRLPDEADRVAGRGERRPIWASTSSRSPTTPISGSGRSRLPATHCRAIRCRR
jgi:hypothetical protein